MARPLNLSADQLRQWRTDGYTIARGLWSADEVDACRRYFDHLATEADVSHLGDDVFAPERGHPDPLRAFPRVLHPHRFHDASRAMLLDRRIEAALRALMGEQPVATQSMYYFKPPGGRGQALHQDNFYLAVENGTCIAAWTAIDPATPDNGGLYLVPGTQGLDLQCPEIADPEESFTTHYVRPPSGAQPVPAELTPGDVLFFNGSVVHGSRANTSDTWRRSFICHYAPASATAIHDWYHPTLNFDGTEHTGLARSRHGSPCGTEFPPMWPPDTFEAAEAAGLQPVKGGSVPR